MQYDTSSHLIMLFINKFINSFLSGLSILQRVQRFFTNFRNKRPGPGGRGRGERRGKRTEILL